MLANLVINACVRCSPLSRPLLRQYLHMIGWVPTQAEWVLLALKRRLVPSPSIRTVSLGSRLRLEIDLANAMGQEIYYHGAHEPDLSRLLKRFLKPGMTFIDLGANVGELTILASHLVGTSGKVYAVEISPYTLPRLRSNIALNRLTNVEVIEAAMCDQDQPVSFYVGSGTDSGSSSLSQPHDYTGECLTVPGMRLDTFASSRQVERIHCLKMDIEGAEMAALAGCTGLLTGPHPPVVIFEYHREVASRMGWTLQDAERWFQEHHYTIKPLTSDSRNHFRANMLALPNQELAALQHLWA